MNISLTISAGELIDKLTILEIKESRIEDLAKLKSVRQEKSIVTEKTSALPWNENLRSLKDELKKVNESLWEIEDELRELERKKDFSVEFIEKARSVYMTNDRRAEIKRAINELLESSIMEVKSYKPYH